jgi:colanic acid/amylovoran biosynthesis protein
MSKKYKILLLHLDTTLNYGSAMMGITTIDYLVKNINKDIQFTVDTSRDVDIDRLKQSTGFESIEKFTYEDRKVKGNKVNKLFTIVGNLFRFRNYCGKYDFVCVLGGDDISEYYSKLNPFIYLFRSYLISKKQSIYIIGQTIGPFRSFNKFIAKFFIPKLNIYTRDRITANYLKDKLSINTVVESRDLAFLPLPHELDNVDDLLFKYNIERNDKYICVVVSGLASHYAYNEADYLESWTNIIKNLLEKELDKKILVLGHVFKDDSKQSDVYFANKVVNNIKSDRLIFIKDLLLPVEARQILGKGEYTITGRMHAAVSTFEMGKPAISLSYSMKYEGVISDGLGMGELVVPNDKLYWSNGTIVSLIIKKIDYVKSNYKELEIDIKLAVEKTRKKSVIQLQDIVKHINNE